MNISRITKLEEGLQSSFLSKAIKIEKRSSKFQIYLTHFHITLDQPTAEDQLVRMQYLAMTSL